MNVQHIKNAAETKTEHDEVRHEKNELKIKRSLVLVLGLFAFCTCILGYAYTNFPELNESEKRHIKIPRDIQDAKMLANVLDHYKDMYYFEVMFAVAVSYIFLQTFAIPGSLFLSILLGFLFLLTMCILVNFSKMKPISKSKIRIYRKQTNFLSFSVLVPTAIGLYKIPDCLFRVKYKFPIALFLICFCSSLGATLCYGLSNLVGRRLIRHFWPEKTTEWTRYVENHRDQLFHYMLFLRITPILPNWFINLASPVIGVPLLTFAFGTFFGVAPPSVLAIQTGKTLQKMTSSSEAFSWTSMAVLGLCATLSILPGIFKNKLKNKLQ